MSASAISQGDLRERIVTYLKQAKKPVTFSALVKGLKVSRELVTSELETVTNSKQAYQWPEYRRSQYFWHVSPDDSAREAVLAAASLIALSKTDLSKRAAKNLQGFSIKRVQSIVDNLVAERELQKVPAFSSSSKILIKPGDREAYLAAAQLFLEKKFKKVGFAPAALTPPEPSASRPDAAALILEAVRTLEPVKGVPVSTLRLRNHLRTLTKQEFDSAALELSKRQVVILSQHADPHNISLEEQDELIDRRDGTYYVGITLC